MDQNLAAETPSVPMWGDVPIPVLALTMCAFCIGTAEFVVMGLLPDIARDLAVSIPLAGQLVTAYALGVVIGAPILAAATAALPRKRVLLMMVGIFIIGNLVSAIAPNYLLLIAARVVAAFAHGTLFGVGAVVAAGMVPANRQARAIGLMFLGLTLANILGVPLGTFVGQNFGWRATFVLITALGIVALVPVYFLVPDIATKASGGMRRELSALGEFDVLLAIATTVLAAASIFTLFTYIVPLLQELGGFTPSSITPILLMIGVGLTVGITLGGRFTDRHGMRASIAMLSVLAAVARPAAARHPREGCDAHLRLHLGDGRLRPRSRPPVARRGKGERRAEPRLHPEHRRLQPRQRRRRLARWARHRSRLGPPSRAPRGRRRRRFRHRRSDPRRRARSQGLTATSSIHNGPVERLETESIVNIR